MRNNKIIYILLGICVALCITVFIAAIVGNDGNDNSEKESQNTAGYDEVEDGDVEIDIGELFG